MIQEMGLPETHEMHRNDWSISLVYSLVYSRVWYICMYI